MTTSKPEKSHPNLFLSEIVFRSRIREPPVRSSCFGALQFSIFAVWALLSPEMDAKRILRLVKYRALTSTHRQGFGRADNALPRPFFECTLGKVQNSWYLFWDPIRITFWAFKQNIFQFFWCIFFSRRRRIYDGAGRDVVPKF